MNMYHPNEYETKRKTIYTEMDIISLFSVPHHKDWCRLRNQHDWTQNAKNHK